MLWSIIGAGNGGQAFAGYLSLKGCRVKIFDVFRQTVDKLNALGGIEIEGSDSLDISGIGKIEYATTDMEEAIKDAKIILVVLPAIYHKEIALKMAPYLVDGQIIILNPNASLGPVEFKKTLDDAGCTAKYILAGSSTLLFACRLTETGHVHIFGKKKYLTIAAYPSSNNDEVEALIKDYLPEFEFVVDIIHVSLDNMNALMHPAPTLLNTGRIESGVDWMYYTDFTPHIGHYVAEIDKERLAIGKAFGFDLISTVDFYKKTYETEGSNIFEVVTNCKGYIGVKGQNSMDTRYLIEDIPYSLVPFKVLADIAKVEAPAIDAALKMAYVMLGEKLSEGRTAKNLGIDSLSKEDFIEMCRK